eukprot:TRINITY_DN3932_c0_g1_i5.p2 TRINITY_DN3932_c0_g1~~TRINITY_DN3932_c0_g1_i5.p2  ORF type:complete len:196 (-),score=-20.11 TRINITY_DN3932_c0_g1_i5:239-826(-)
MSSATLYVYFNAVFQNLLRTIFTVKRNCYFCWVFFLPWGIQLAGFLVETPRGSWGGNSVVKYTNLFILQKINTTSNANQANRTFCLCMNSQVGSEPQKNFSVVVVFVIFINFRYVSIYFLFQPIVLFSLFSAMLTVLIPFISCLRDFCYKKYYFFYYIYCICNKFISRQRDFCYGKYYFFYYMYCICNKSRLIYM